MDVYQLKPRIPGGTWLSVILIVLGTLMVVVSLIGMVSMGLRVTGGIVVLLGLILLTITIVAVMRSRVTVTLDDEGYSITSPRGEFYGTWADITDVSVSRKTAKIALWHGPQRRTVIAHPAGIMDDEFMGLRESIRDHLETLQA
ncbi:MAG: hypothetical protein FWD75_05140 [Propionibacteriaceae bacterium]|nr:hypothetical protein [Propionibacteriaceae bacterium]